MALSTAKCAVLYTGSQSPTYILNGLPIPVVTSVIDFGVDMSLNLDVSKNVTGVIKWKS